jgi:hypothetical protein
MASCALITLGATYDCTNPIVPGVNTRLILINKDEVATVTKAAPYITAITLDGTKTGFAFEGYRQSLNPEYTLVPASLSIGYDHQIKFQVFDISQEQKENLQKMALGRMVAIVENMNNEGNDDNVFEVYGIDVGMEIMEMNRIARDMETQGSFSVLLKSPDDEGKEPKMPVTWFDTDYATTKALVDALLV